MERRYKHSFSELLDKLMLCQLKQSHGGEYTQEISDIMNDIDIMIAEGIPVGSEMIRAIIVLTQANSFIWQNEDMARKGTPENNNLYFTHQLNATRSESKSVIEKMIGGRTDEKLNYLSGAWKISW